VFQFNDLREELAQYLDHDKIAEISKAYAVAATAHEHQKRQTGDPYIIHPIAVARILAQQRMDHETIMAALLHDVLEDTAVDKDTLSKEFGPVVADMVDGVSKLTQIHFESREEAQAENFRKMLLAMTKDIRVILIKLADRLHNMRTIDALQPVRRRRIARETLEIYAPIANRLGMHNIRVEFEDLGFAALYPQRYRVLKSRVRKARGNRKQIFKNIENELKKCFKNAKIPESAIKGREKHLYSIYRKMRGKNISFNEVMDVYAFRVIVPTVDECYRVLGLVHNLYKPVPGRFKDYIAIPKANGYQSLHTVLFGPYGVPIEIQIRTQEMDRLAENGIAAHWLYKTPSTSVDKAQAWLSNLLSLQKSTGSSLEFIENVKIDLFPDEVYVFTPKGEIMELPGNATAVDFAYAVHTDVGNSCVAAKIDRRLAPLSTRLSNGQTVEVISAVGARPNPAWLNFVVTGKARSSIRHFLKSQQRAELILLGQRLLNVALRAIALTMEKIPQESITDYLAESEYEDLDALHEAIGKGERSASLVARQLAVQNNGEQQLIDEQGTDSQAALTIKGTEGMMVKFAKCCWPIPNDPILGLMSAGHGLSVHQETCRRVKNLSPDSSKTIVVQWEEHPEGEFQVELKIEARNKRGILASLASAVALAGANIDMVKTEDKDGRYTTITIIISIHNRAHLARVIRGIRGNKSVTKVVRSIGR
jgi:RelA/SpoT family (p)ppGpp synthetase